MHASHLEVRAALRPTDPCPRARAVMVDLTGGLLLDTVPRASHPSNVFIPKHSHPRCGISTCHRWKHHDPSILPGAVNAIGERSFND